VHSPPPLRGGEGGLKFYFYWHAPCLLMRPPYGILDMSSRLLLANVKSCAVIYINIYKIRRRRGTPPPAPLLQPKAGGGIGACKPEN